MTTITLVTGANQGIGLATAIALAKVHKHHVIIGSRNTEAGKKVAAQLLADGYSASSVQLDLVSDASIEAAVKSIEKEHGRLDVLINNAAILLDREDQTLSRKLFTQTFETNLFGTAILTEALVPLLRKSSNPNIVFVSSRMGSLHLATDKTAPAYPFDYRVYDSSKVALNMLALNYARILEEVGAKVNIVCPQIVKTNLTRHLGYGITPEEGAERIVELATMKKDDTTNRTFSDRDGMLAW